jgi:hypothetical protein
MIEGAIRKWLLPEYSNEVFVVKDIFLAFTFAVCLLDRGSEGKLSPSTLLWLLWTAFVVGHALLTGFSLTALIGLRYYLAPLPLLIIVPALVRGSADLDKLAIWAVRLSFPIGALAILQYYSPPDSLLNTYAWSSEGISDFGVEEGGELTSGIARSRVTSTFSYISTYAAYLSAIWLLAWMSVLNTRSVFDRAAATLALILTAFNMGMNGSRALIVFAVISALPFAFPAIRRLGLQRTQLLAVAVMVIVGYASISVFEPFLLTADRGDAEEASGRIVGILGMPLVTFSEISFLGTGVGTSFQGFEQLSGASSQFGDAIFNEINQDRVGIELGLFGYVLLLALKLTVLAKTIGVYRHLASSDLRYWALAALLIQLGSGWQIPFYNAVAAVCYFSAIGLVYWLEGEAARMRYQALRGRRNDSVTGNLASRGW